MSGNNGAKQAEPAYMLPHSHQEIERMKNQHEWIKGSFGGLIKAPINLFKKHQRILDSAAADGTWLCDISTLFPPETELVGFDIAPQLYPPPDRLPPNVNLVPGDLSKALPAEWDQHFDLVHQRFVFPGFSSAIVGQFLGRLMACVKPGGWIQLVEPAADENVSGPDAVGFAVLHRLAAACTQCPDPRDTILSTLKDGGFINVNIQTMDLVVGVFQENRELDARGRKSMRDARKEVANIKSRRSPEALGMSEADWETVLHRFDTDMEKYRTAVRHNIIWAQRPE
ncbi:S-adenosyl-L-methionine-dependent methyltransferase [Parachaetomium inaequale]|uniref:S-adenosyl-L-methionine-dependent methyltransferase n=1 Tax=Parachaetomium inaequale TaxID=2588326 RepID=A0AAN6PHX5_9PEZI|nr:S-adenosyl-L-methionine-dependent methyltransferase [Parachaetomium inaequale]